MIVSSLNNFQIFKIFVNFALLCVFKSSMFQNIIHKIFSVKFQVNSQNFKWTNTFNKNACHEKQYKRCHQCCSVGWKSITGK